MSNKNSKLVKEDELKKALNQVAEDQEEILDDAPDVDDDEDFDEDEPEEDKKVKITVPKWLVTTGKVIVGALAAFGTCVTGLLIYDKVKKSKKTHYASIPVEPRRELPDSTHQVADTFNTEFKDLVKEDLGTDVKIEI